ncbi:MAG: HIT family protein [Acidobacteria bacterium]|nr:HIT family protein [Acidobacteriota bacterium]
MTVDVSATCAFCAIVAGRSKADIVFRDAGVTAFLDRIPLFVGHTLVVPDEHHETLADLPHDAVGGFFTQVQRLSALMPAALGAAGTFVAMNNTVSQSVPHLHVHVVPRRAKDGLKGFFWPRTRYESPQHAASTAALLQRHWDEAATSAG